MIQLFAGKDYSRIFNIWERSVEASHDFLSVEDFLFYKDKVEIFFAQVTIYVFEDDNIIKGFLGVSEDNIEMLFVDSYYFGEGVGRDLLLYAINDLKINKVDVNQQNTNAFEFYIKFGFKEVNLSSTDNFGKLYPISHLEFF